MPYAASSTAESPESGSPAARTLVPGRDAVLPAVCTVHAGPAPSTVCVAPGGRSIRAVRSRSSTSRVRSRGGASPRASAIRRRRYGGTKVQRVRDMTPDKPTPPTADKGSYGAAVGQLAGAGSGGTPPVATGPQEVTV